MTTRRLHPDLEGNQDFAHLFTIKPGHPEEANIGKQCKFNNPTCEIEQKIFTIGSLQFDWRGTLCYRVYFDGDTFGRVALPSAITIL